ncbi:MAG: ATP-binding protein, partial [Oscillospiraceae bacterium]|nr:ATP-binding protein [Oscillospiraceae bacterium]
MSLRELLAKQGPWTAPALPDEIPHGDMPGDKIVIGEDHIRKAQLLFPRLLEALKELEGEKAVVSVFGGSGVGKSEIASLLAWYLKDIGVGSYVISGDNYPRRIPLYNDAERLSIFRVGGLRGLDASGYLGLAVYFFFQTLPGKTQSAKWR